MKERGYDILAVPCDVTDIDSCAKAVAEVQAKLGPIEVLVNNTDIPRDMTFKKMDKVNWDAVIPKEVLDNKILPQIPVGRLGKPEEVAGLII